MMGRLYLCLRDGHIDITDDVDVVGKDRIIYKTYSGEYMVDCHNIFEFMSKDSYTGDDKRAFDTYINDIDEFIRFVWIAKYHPDADKHPFAYRGKRMNYLADAPLKGEEGFIFTRIHNMEGREAYLYVGDRGNIVIKSDNSHYTIAVKWDESLSPYYPGIITIKGDAFSYNISYKDVGGKPNVGYGRASNKIFNYISAFGGAGVTTRAIESKLSFGHPTIAGRISDMSRIGRIVKVGEVRLATRGLCCSIWTISKGE